MSTMLGVDDFRMSWCRASSFSELTLSVPVYPPDVSASRDCLVEMSDQDQMSDISKRRSTPTLDKKRGRSQSLAVPQTSGKKSAGGLLASVRKRKKDPDANNDSLVRHQSLDLSIDDESPKLNGFPATIDGCRSPRRMSLAESLQRVKNIRLDYQPSRKRTKQRAKKSRLILKDGECNVYNSNVPKKEQNYIRDIFTTLIDVKWRWILLTFSVVFACSWLVFAITYFLICYFHGDLEQGFPAPGTPNTTALQPCIAQIDSFVAAFLFSVETQHTIGYGHRYITTACFTAPAAVCAQSLCGLLIQSFMVGLVFAKMARPKKRAATLIFSEKAVISLQDGLLCFLLRVGDMRNSHLVEAHVRMQLIRQRVTEEGEVEPLHQFEMDIGFDQGSDRIFLVWPIVICHVINSSSPLYEYSARDLPLAHFEIIVILEGIVESTGMTAQARTSYLPSEILWGHRFEKLVTYQKCNGSYKIDYGVLHTTYPVNTPRCSAKHFEEMKKCNLVSKCKTSFFHKTETEAQLEDNNSEEGYTPAASPNPLNQSEINEESHPEPLKTYCLLKPPKRFLPSANRLIANRKDTGQPAPSLLPLIDQQIQCMDTVSLSPPPPQIVINSPSTTLREGFCAEDADTVASDSLESPSPIPRNALSFLSFSSVRGYDADSTCTEML